MDTGIEVVIIRPPLVYGPGVKANFAALMRAVQRGWPLPLGAVHNQRSLVALDNLVDFIITCMTHLQAANQTFLVSDGQDLSTTELVRGMAQAAGVSARLLPVPVWVLQAGAKPIAKPKAQTKPTAVVKPKIVLKPEPVPVSTTNCCPAPIAVARHRRRISPVALHAVLHGAFSSQRYTA